MEEGKQEKKFIFPYWIKMGHWISLRGSASWRVTRVWSAGASYCSLLQLRKVSSARSCPSGCHLYSVVNKAVEGGLASGQLWWVIVMLDFLRICEFTFSFPPLSLLNSASPPLFTVDIWHSKLYLYWTSQAVLQAPKRKNVVVNMQKLEKFYIH